MKPLAALTADAVARGIVLVMLMVLACQLTTPAQNTGREPIGLQGHDVIQTPKPSPMARESRIEIPAFPLTQPTELPKKNEQAALSTLDFPIQQPPSLAMPVAQPRPALAATSPVASVPDPQIKQWLNEGYQAVARQDYPTAIANFRLATQRDPQNSQLWLELVYALGNFNQLPEAVEAVLHVIQIEPANGTARSQLGYLLIRQDRIREAIDAFLAAESLDPLNYSLKLQLGYLYDRVHDKNRASQKFTQASGSTDLDIQQKAINALKALAPVIFSHRWMWTNEIYAAPTYYRRFNNLISPYIFRSGLILSNRIGLESYFSARATRDTRSSGGNAPQIFEDNFAIASLGLRARPLKNALTVYAEAGLAFNLVPSRLATVKARNDFRAGAYYSHTWGKRTASDKFSMPFNPVGEIYLDASYYSRFRHNVIGYLQAREGVRVLQTRQSSLEAYGRFNLVKDAGRDFFNNLVEAGAGLGFTPFQKLGFRLTAEYLRGVYLGQHRRGEPNPYAQHYGDFRVGMIFGKYLVKE